MNRRRFLASGALSALAGLALQAEAQQTNAAPVAVEKKPEPPKRPAYRIGLPVVQVPAETAMSIAWTVSEYSQGEVEYSEREDLSGKMTVKCQSERPGLYAADDRVLSARLYGLKPNTRYFYRVHAWQHKWGEKQHATSEVYSFCTLGAGAASSFAAINDTHEQIGTFAAAKRKIDELDAAVMVWNGDIWNGCDSREKGIKILLEAGGTGYAVSRPLLYTSGNHDYRGRYVDRIGELFLRRYPEELGARFWRLGNNYALRQGKIALIGMDTGEDKPDRHPEMHGRANFEEYRKQEAEWLEEALERPEIKSAPFVVLFCHIPLFDSRPMQQPGEPMGEKVANPGDVMYGYANWQRPAATMWGPIMQKHRIQLVVAAHEHTYRYDPPTADRCWGQIVGGGPRLSEGARGATVIHGEVREGRLVVRSINLKTGRDNGVFTFAPRF